jgi:hypothetical protein
MFNLLPVVVIYTVNIALICVHYSGSYGGSNHLGAVPDHFRFTDTVLAF